MSSRHDLIRKAASFPAGHPERKRILASLERTAMIDAYGDNVLDLIENWLGEVLSKNRVGYEDLWSEGNGKFIISMSEEGWDEYAPSETIGVSWQVEVSLFGKSITVKDQKGRKAYKKFSVNLFSSSASDIAKLIQSSVKYVPSPVSPYQPDTPSLQDTHPWAYSER